MSDRKLLEDAARAAGLLAWGPWYAMGIFAGLTIRKDDNPSGYLWNPLTDDGDALRLAVRLRITFRYYDSTPPKLNMPWRCAVAFLADMRRFAEDGADECAATRRAITRAAAAMAPTPTEDAR